MFEPGFFSSPAPKVCPQVRLWILRILMQLNAHRKFVRSHDFDDDDIAVALGFRNFINTDPGKFSPEHMRNRLRSLHERAELRSGKVHPPPVIANNISKLAKMFELTREDCEILAFTVHLHTEELLDTASDWLGQLSTAKVIRALSKILGLPARKIMESLGPEGILTRSGLISISRHGVGSLRAKLDLLSASFADLLSSTRVDPIELLRGTVAMAPRTDLDFPDYAHLKPSLEILQPYLRHALATKRRGVNIFLHGPPGTGKTQLARLMADSMKCRLFEVSSEDEDGDPLDGQRRLRAFRAAQTLLSKQRAVILFDEVEDVFNDGSEFLGRKSTAQTRKAWMNRMLEDANAPTFWLSNSIHSVDAAFIRRFDMIIEVPVPPRSQRQRIVERACYDLVDKQCISRLSEADILAPAVIARASSVVRTIRQDLGDQGVVRALEHLVGSTLEAQGHKRLIWHDPNRLPDIYDLAFLNPDTNIDVIAAGLRQSGQGRICLYGPPGTGKTAFGRWLALQLDLPLHVKRASDLLSPFIGMTERNLARAFRDAQRESALLMVDEVDSFLRDRKDAQRPWEASQVNEMLTQMEAFPGIFIASTNLMAGLDPAALRRFDAKIHFGFLKPEQAIAMFREHCRVLGLEAPGRADEGVLSRLANLAPGDFAAMARQNRFRRVDSPSIFARLLQAECALKGESRRPIGFVH